MEIDFLVRVSARMDFCCRVKIFHRSSQIVYFPQRQGPESNKIGVWSCASVKMGFTQQP